MNEEPAAEATLHETDAAERIVHLNVSSDDVVLYAQFVDVGFCPY